MHINSKLFLNDSTGSVYRSYQYSKSFNTLSNRPTVLLDFHAVEVDIGTSMVLLVRIVRGSSSSLGDANTEMVARKATSENDSYYLQ